MKKFLLLLLLLFVSFCGYVLYTDYYNKEMPKLTIEEKIINIDQLYIYGTHLNLGGNIIDGSNLQLVLYNGEFLEYEINIDDNTFNLSDKVNDGILLDDIPIGTYYVFIRDSIKNNENDKLVYKYYGLNNTTKYNVTTYYTFSNVGNKITIDTDSEYTTLRLTVEKNRDDNIYDVIVDPGHGGVDSGASKNGNKEAIFTMKLANSLKSKLENYGVKVLLTREEGQLAKDERLPDYGLHGRSVVSHETFAKYLFSIHLNSSNNSKVNGVEVYTAAKINYDFANDLAKNIKEYANINYSKNSVDKVFDGVYTRIFTEREIKKSIDEYTKENKKPYDVTTKSNYYFMIREPGSIITGAYVDNRNDPEYYNLYFDSNIGTESYLLELGYLTNSDDIKSISTNMDKYTDAIADSFKKVFNNNDIKNQD